MLYLTLAILLLIVVAIWFLARKYPSLKRLRLSAIISLAILLITIITFSFLWKVFQPQTANNIASVISYIVLKPSHLIAFLVYAFLLAISIDIGDNGMQICMLSFSFGLNTLIVLGILTIINTVHQTIKKSKPASA